MSFFVENIRKRINKKRWERLFNNVCVKIRNKKEGLGK